MNNNIRKPVTLVDCQDKSRTLEVIPENNRGIRSLKCRVYFMRGVHKVFAGITQIPTNLVVDRTTVEMYKERELSQVQARHVQELLRIGFKQVA